MKKFVLLLFLVCLTLPSCSQTKNFSQDTTFSETISLESTISEDISSAGGKSEGISSSDTEEKEYILNKSSKKIHLPNCRSVKTMSEKKKCYYFGTMDEVVQKGYDPCGHCCS